VAQSIAVLPARADEMIEIAEISSTWNVASWRTSEGTTPHIQVRLVRYIGFAHAEFFADPERRPLCRGATRNMFGFAIVRHSCELLFLQWSARLTHGRAPAMLHALP
jgi:hypothetical protein